MDAILGENSATTKAGDEYNAEGMMKDPISAADSALVKKKIKIQLPPPPRAAQLLFDSTDDGYSNNSKRLYWDRSHYASPAEQMQALVKSSTLYVGNLAFSTRSNQVRSHFSQLGLVKAIHMGLDRVKKTPCGFCFVEYFSRRDALAAVALISGTKMDGRVIRVELDAGFQPGRQYGRGMSGGQVRDDRAATARRRGSNVQRKRSRPPPPPGPPPPRPSDGGHNNGGDNNNAVVDFSENQTGDGNEEMEQGPAKRRRKED